MKVKIEGIPALKKALSRKLDLMGKAFEAGCYTVADTFILRNDVYVPEDSGALGASGGYFQDGKGFETVTVIGYGFMTDETFYRGNRTTPQEPWLYAVIQEDEYPNKLTPGTIMLYMEIGFENYRDEAYHTIIAALESV